MQVRKLPSHRLDPTNAKQDPTKAVTSLNSLRMQHEPCYWPISGNATKLILELIRPTHDLYLMNDKGRPAARHDQDHCGEGSKLRSLQ